MTAPAAPVPPAGTPFPDAARAALEQGRKLEAVKLVREYRGTDLKEAKEQVDAFIAGQPHLQAKFAADYQATRRGCVLSLLIVIGLLVAAFLLLTKKG